MRSETLRMALQVLTRNPGRSALTVLGLAIGVAAFIAMVSFGQGARRSVLSQFESLGANILRVRSRAGAADALAKPPHPLAYTDVVELRRDSTAIATIVPNARRAVDLNHGAARVRTALIGTTPEYAALHDFRFEWGGMFDAGDDSRAAKVCVLGASPARKLFDDGNALGGKVTIAGKFPCRVIGVLASKGRALSGSDLDDFVLTPVRAFQLFLGMEGGFSGIELRPSRPEWLEAARTEADQILRRAHRLSADEPADFDVVSPDDVTRAADQTSRILTGLLAGIAAVSLLVGGIGIMNIQLVAVAERTHEIGIRAAIGASPGQILKQFLVESSVLAAVGSLAGVLAGVGTANVVAHVMRWPAAISLPSVIGSGLFGITVGVIFGYVPALRAARLDPIQALRRE
jgi:putative ABC transport system permease protein